MKGKRDAPSLPANVTCPHSTQTNRSESAMCVSGRPGVQSCKCSCEVTFSQAKHSLVTMVATQAALASASCPSAEPTVRAPEHNGLLSFPKIISDSDDAIRTTLVWCRWSQTVGRTVVTACPCPTPSACASHCNRANYKVRIRRKCRSPLIRTWSKHSRRSVPIRRSTYAFCQGDLGEIGRSRIPIVRTRFLNARP